MKERNIVLGLAHHFGVVLLDRHHGEAAVGIHGDEIGDRRPQRKALDAGAEFLRQQQRGIQRRRHREPCSVGTRMVFMRAPHMLPA